MNQIFSLLTAFMLSVMLGFAPAAYAQDNATIKNDKENIAATLPNIGNAELRSQVENLQESILADENILGSVEEMLKDPAIVAVLSDKQFMADVMSFDEKKISDNPKMQQLLSNPAMQALIKRIQEKVESEQAAKASPSPAAAKP